MNLLLLRALALCAGLTLGLQPPINARLRAATGDPFWAAAMSFFVGTVALAVIALIVRAPLPALASGFRAPWYVWTGGLLGAIYVTSSIVVVPRLGAAQMLSFAVLGMMLAGLCIDQLGLFGLAVKPVSFFRFFGAALLVAGVAFITRA